MALTMTNIWLSFSMVYPVLAVLVKVIPLKGLKCDEKFKTCNKMKMSLSLTVSQMLSPNRLGTGGMGILTFGKWF